MCPSTWLGEVLAFWSLCYLVIQSEARTDIGNQRQTGPSGEVGGFLVSQSSSGPVGESRNNDIKSEEKWLMLFDPSLRWPAGLFTDVSLAAFKFKSHLGSIFHPLPAQTCLKTQATTYLANIFLLVCVMLIAVDLLNKPSAFHLPV